MHARLVGKLQGHLIAFSPDWERMVGLVETIPYSLIYILNPADPRHTNTRRIGIRDVAQQEAPRTKVVGHPSRSLRRYTLSVSILPPKGTGGASSFD